MINIEHIETAGLTSDIIVVSAIVLGVISFILALYKVFKNIDARIDLRIDERIKPSLELLKDTVGVVKNLEKNTAEMNATLSILKEILLAHSTKPIK